MGRGEGLGEESFLPVDLWSAPDESVCGAAMPLEDGKDFVNPLIHGEAEDFGGEEVAIPIDDQAGEAIPFGVDQAIGIGMLREFQKILA